jgi:hypothetical protein
MARPVRATQAARRAGRDASVIAFLAPTTRRTSRDRCSWSTATWPSCDALARRVELCRAGLVSPNHEDFRGTSQRTAPVWRVRRIGGYWQPLVPRLPRVAPNEPEPSAVGFEPGVRRGRAEVELGGIAVEARTRRGDPLGVGVASPQMSEHETPYHAAHGTACASAFVLRASEPGSVHGAEARLSRKRWRADARESRSLSFGAGGCQRPPGTRGIRLTARERGTLEKR